MSGTLLALRERPVLLGALALLVSELSFALLGALVKLLAADLSHVQIVFFRNAAALLFVLPWLLRHGGLTFEPARLRFHLLRSCLGIAGMYCLFYALAKMPLAQAVLLAQTAPIWLPLIAFFWLREPVGPAPIGAVLLGFAGVVVILQPWGGDGGFSPVALVGLFGALCAALAKITIRRMAGRESSVMIVFYFTLLSTLVSAVPLVFDWRPVPRSLWGYLLALGLTAALGQILMTKAFTLAPAGRIGPLSYAQIVFASLLGVGLFNERLELHTVLGALLIAYAGLTAMGLVRIPMVLTRRKR